MRFDVPPVAVAGGGFSGVMTAVQLASRGVPTMLFDGSGRLGRGVAYSTGEAAHLLNVPAGKMSAWPDRPDDFAAWLSDDGTGFAERRAFGSYVEQILHAAPDVQCRAADVVAAEPMEGGWRLRTSDGGVVEASALVLANGNQPPGTMNVARDLPGDLFIGNPWSSEAASAVKRAAETDAEVLLLGTGLTMIDTVLSLDAAGHRGRVLALSRRGLMPRAHAAHETVPVRAEEVPHGYLLGLWCWVRRRSVETGFRAAVDSLRPHSQALWRSLDVRDRRRFLRHARPWWDVHRHRIAPQIARQLATMIAEERLQVMAGRVRFMEKTGDELTVSLDRRGGRREERRFGLAFNCTGPLGEMSRTRDPLLRQLLNEGLVQADDLGMGLAVGGPGRAGERLWAVGPLTKGTYWEIVAVPDIRGQAAEIADDIAKELGR